MSVRLQCGDVVLVYTSQYGGKQGIGLIKYIGHLQNDIMKEYVGIELIEPIENGHNGCIDGIQYFSCKESYGIHTLTTNVIKILQSREIMIKLQEVIEMFKNKLSQYIQALNQRDSYISDLIITQKKLKSQVITLRESQSPNDKNTNNNSHINKNNASHSNTHTHYSHTTAPLTPIADSNNIYLQNQQQNISYEQMMHNVDNAITAQSLAIKLDAKRVTPLTQMRYQTPLTHKSSNNNYSPITATNTLDSGTPSSMTPAPTNNIKKKHSNKSRDTTTNTTTNKSPQTPQTMLIHDDMDTSTYRDTVTPIDDDDRIGAIDIDDDMDDISDEPDPLMTPTMDPIAETHSFGNPNNNNLDHPNWIRHNTMDTRSPSQPRLFKNESNAISTLSGNTHSPHTPYNGNGHMIYYPEYEDIQNDNHSTSSYFSATSSTYNTPKSATVSASKANNNITAHGLLATWNARKLSKQSNRSKASISNPNEMSMVNKQPKINKAKSYSRSKLLNKNKMMNKNVPHIYTGTNTPTLSANNDAILSGKAYDLAPLKIPKRKSNQKNNNSKLKLKRRKSKELKISTNAPHIGTPATQLRNRSSSLIFTPSQLESAAKYSFKTIPEEPGNNSNNNNNNTPMDSPRFGSHHSTPIFHAAANTQNMNMNMYYPDNIENNSSIIDDDIIDIDNMTPELPPQTMQNNPSWHQRASLPPQTSSNNVLKSRYDQSQQRSSLPPQQPNMNSRHMQASSQINIAVPTFINHNKQHKQIHFQSLQNIHEHNTRGNIPKQTNIAYHQSAPQLDHWVDPLQPQQIQQQRPISAHNYHNHNHNHIHNHSHNQANQANQQQINEYNEYNEVPNALPPMNNKAKSMPASFHVPSQMSLDMNPYIDQAFLFQPQISSQPYNEYNINEYNMNMNMNVNDMDAAIEGVPCGPPIRRHNRSPLNGPMPPNHGNMNNNMAYSVHSGSGTGTNSSPQQSAMNNINNMNNMNNINMAMSIPQPIITTTVNTKIGKVHFQPRKSISKQLRKNNNNNKQLLNKNKNNTRNHKNNKVQRAPTQHAQQQHNKSVKSQNKYHMSQQKIANIGGFTFTDAMYD